ncbi:hypothetical protein EEL31_23870 [Brevibacillus laterosporus]|nr:hypothetical protein [Brevibacillus laterosporus]TPG71169.1 hypothetical protein EEL31_23870 [Brevibacillus laterosporus]
MTSKELIAKLREKNEKSKTKVKKTRKVYLKKLDMHITVEEADKAFLDDFKFKKLYSSLSPEELKKTNEELVYNFILTPNLRDEELIEELKVKSNPIKVLNKIFEIEEVVLIANAILNISDVDINEAVTVVDDLKNS